MTDPVDTDALRAARRLVARLDENCLANAEAPNADDLVTLARDAYEEGQEDAELRSADEVDRLRMVIVSAPHAEDCLEGDTDRYTRKPFSCTCWKAELT